MAVKTRSAKSGKYVDPEEAKKNPDTTVVERSKGSQAPRKAAKKASLKYYRSALAGLKVILKIGDPMLSDTIEAVRFAPYVERQEGDDVKVGYLASDDPRVHERLENDANVTEITADEFKLYTEGGKIFGKAHVPKRASY